MIGSWRGVALVVTLAVLACALIWGGGSTPAGAAEPRCRIGKPTYCLKYASFLCPKENVRADREASCEAWLKGCFACHAAIPACFGERVPEAKSVACKTCESEWRDCMHKNDDVHWPNRRAPRGE